MRNDESMRRAIGTAWVVTFNIRMNCLGHTGEAYENGVCGAGDVLDCLRVAVEKVEENWDAEVAGS